MGSTSTRGRGAGRGTASHSRRLSTDRRRNAEGVCEVGSVLQFSRKYQVEIHPVDSSVLAAVGYDRERRGLEARFCNGRVYPYYDVPPGELGEGPSAKSGGWYFNRAI